MKKVNILVDSNKRIKNQGDLFGIFFEDLNHAADGGLYGELVQNRSFEFDAVDAPGYHALTAWEKVERGDSVVCIHVEEIDGMNENNPHYLVLEVLTDGEGGGIRNLGFDEGIFVQEGMEYRFSCWYKLRNGKENSIKVRLEDETGLICYGEVNFTAAKRSWQKVELCLAAAGTDRKARLALLAQEPVALELDMISLFPVNTYKGRDNGLRADLAEMLADMKPCFMRFPGGCLTHIGSLNEKDRSGMYRWKNTLGPVEQRPSRRNTWNYNQTLGLGFYEFFLFCEDIGAEPLPVISAGYDPHFLRMAKLDKMQEWIDDALDLIEFANGGTNTHWGAKRAKMGHPESFHMKYLGIGNEEVGDAFFERFEIIMNAVKDKHPEIQVIGSAGPGSAGSEFDKGWAQARRTRTSFIDEHFYQCPDWFLANADRYQSYPKEPKAFLGEYASGGETWKNALMEAAFMTGMEKAEGVGMACYAPMLCHAGYRNWFPNMLTFDNTRVYGNPSYYVQKLFMRNQGEALLQTRDDLNPVSGKLPALDGIIRMKTETACVDIRNFTVTEKDGRIQCLENFSLTKETSCTWELEVNGDSYMVSFLFKRMNGGRSVNLNGSNSFCMEFGVRDEEHKLYWVFDGWQRLTSLRGMYQGKECDMGLALLETKREQEYEAKLVVNGRKISLWIDGTEYLSHVCRSVMPEELYYSAVEDADGSVVVKAVNAQEEEKELCIRLSDCGLTGRKVRIAAMQGYGLQECNSLDEPERVIPVENEEICTEDAYHFKIMGNSFAVIRFER